MVGDHQSPIDLSNQGERGASGPAGGEEEQELRPHERKLLNWVVHDYLVRQGYRCQLLLGLLQRS